MKKRQQKKDDERGMREGESSFTEGVCSRDPSFAVYVVHAVINVMIRIRERKNDESGD